MARRLSSWHVSRIRAAYRRTGSCQAAAKSAHVSLSTVYRVLADLVKQAGYTTRLIREAVDLYRAGHSTRAVARILRERISPSPTHESVRGWVRAAGVTRSKTRAQEMRHAHLARRDYDALRERARFLAIEKLWSIHQIARTLNVGCNFVKRVVPREYRCNPSLATERRKWQAFLPDVEKRRKLREEVLRRRSRGEKYPAIAAATGLSKDTVWRYCHGAGLTHAIRPRRLE